MAIGGKAVGSVDAPVNTPDFSSDLLQAQASKAKVVALANAGGDMTNSIKQAHEFGLTGGGQKLAALLLFVTDVHALGLDVAQGLNVASSFYWDRDAGDREFSQRFSDRMKTHAMPTRVQAGVYAALLHLFQGAGSARGQSLMTGKRSSPK